MNAVGLDTDLFLKTLLNGKPIIQVLPTSDLKLVGQFTQLIE
jgi:hypothetical protein